MHGGASTEPKIARHKSTMENPPLYREKNEVAGTGKIGADHSTGAGCGGGLVGSQSKEENRSGE